MFGFWFLCISALFWNPTESTLSKTNAERGNQKESEPTALALFFLDEELSAEAFNETFRILRTVGNSITRQDHSVLLYSLAFDSAEPKFEKGTEPNCRLLERAISRLAQRVVGQSPPLSLDSAIPKHFLIPVFDSVDFCRPKDIIRRLLHSRDIYIRDPMGIFVDLIVFGEMNGTQWPPDDQCSAEMDVRCIPMGFFDGPILFWDGDGSPRIEEFAKSVVKASKDFRQTLQSIDTRSDLRRLYRGDFVRPSEYPSKTAAMIATLLSIAAVLCCFSVSSIFSSLQSTLWQMWMSATRKGIRHEFRDPQ